MQYFTLDTITDIAFGKPFGDVPADKDVHQYIELAETMFPPMCIAHTIPGVLEFLQAIQKVPWIAALVMPSYEDKAGFGVLMAWVNYVAQKVLVETDMGLMVITSR